MVHNVHDALFKSTFSQVEHAAGYLRALLPAGLVARIDFSTLALRSGSFVDEALAQQQSDLLFSVSLSGREARIYVLFEHKSAPETLTAFQMLRYMVRIWEDFVKDHATARILPAIVPIVVHHGEGGWTAARDFQDLIDTDPEVIPDLAPYLPKFRFALDDLGQHSDEDLRDRAMSALGRLSLFCLRHARTPEQIVQGMRRWLDLVREVRRAPHGVAALVRIWRYVLLVGDRFGPEDLVARLVAAIGEEDKEEVMTAGEILIARGHEQGLRKGIEQGLEQGLEQGREQGLRKGIEQGLEQGREQGRKEGLRLSIETICEVLGIEIDAARRAEMDRLDAAGLEAMLARLKTTRAWG